MNISAFWSKYMSIGGNENKRFDVKGFHQTEAFPGMCKRTSSKPLHGRIAKRNSIFKISLAFLVSLCVNAHAYSPNQMERAVLVDVFNSLGGARWKNSSGWNDKNVNHCSWFGVTCGTDANRVTRVNLMENGCSGAFGGGRGERGRIFHSDDDRNLSYN